MKKADYLQRSKELGIDATEENTVKELQAMIAEKEQGSDAKHPSKNPVNPDVTDIDTADDDEDSRADKSTGIYTDKRGLKWQFKKSAPKTINIDGHPMLQAEILEDEEIMAELVYGESNFLTQKS